MCMKFVAVDALVVAFATVLVIMLFGFWFIFVSGCRSTYIALQQRDSMDMCRHSNYTCIYIYTHKYAYMRAYVRRGVSVSIVILL